MGSLLMLKDNSVRPKDLAPQLVLAMIAIKEIYDHTFPPNVLQAYPFVITSLNDNKHMQGSLHYEGRAFDLRIWAFQKNQDALKNFIAQCKKALGVGYDIVLESTHIHVEYDDRHYG